MPLPPLTMPDALPPFLVQNHGTQWGDPFGSVPMRTGSPRKRRKWTSVPQLVAVSQLLERNEMTSFYFWHRDSLLRGERFFSARVKAEGVGMLWYRAFFAEMYQADAMHLGRWTVSANLWLFGDGQVDGPALGDFTADAVIAFTGSGVLTVEKNFAAEASIDFIVSEES